jgi:hypothetical protein
MTATSASLSRGGLVLAAATLALWLQPSLRGDGGTARAQSATPPGEAAPTPAPAGADFARDREKIFDAFYRTGLDVARPYAVTNLSIKKDNVTLLLKQGVVFLSQPIAGEITGAAFLGEGLISMTPPNRTERYMLKKHYGAEVLNEPFAEAVFRFTDGTHRTIIGSGKPDPAAAGQAARAAEIYGERNGYLNGNRDLALDMQWLENRISKLNGADSFTGQFRFAKHGWVSFVHNPVETLENEIFTDETMGGGGRWYKVTWTEWHEAGDYDPTGHYVKHPGRDGPSVLRVRHEEMTLDMPTTKSVEWDARLRIEPMVEGIRAVRLDLVNNSDFNTRWFEDQFYPNRLLEVNDEAGRPLEHLHRRDCVLVLLPAPAGTGTPLVLRFRGKADVIYQLTAESFGLLESAWYPQYGYVGGRRTFDWTVRVPRPFLISGSGTVVRELEDKEKGQNIMQARSEAPVTIPFLIFGRFQKAESVYTNEESKRTVKLTIHSFPNMTIPVTDPELIEELELEPGEPLQLSAPLKKINGFFTEGKEILKLYEKIYGPYPYDELHIGQMAPQLGFGQGPPGFVRLTGAAFMSQAETESDFIHGFLSHEFAHQWWGNQVGWASDDDEWLSEAFAEYASGIFVKEYQGAKRFQRTLEEWKRFSKNSDKEAPIAAANTLSGPTSSGYRGGLLYQKGAYVLHMLRTQLNDDKYVEVMRSIQENYRHQNISTEMLLREVNRVTKADYTSFFDQWVWDVGIPTFEYRWRSEKQPDGKFLITVHVGQRDKTNVKKVLMPVHIHFKDKSIPQYKPVVQADQELKILSPMEPKNVTLDDDHTLLADFVKLD